MDTTEEKDSFDALKKGGSSARNESDEGHKDEVATHELCDDFNGKKHSNLYFCFCRPPYFRH